jgi:predicted DNA-binding protein
MAVSEARKRANAKWDKANRKNAACALSLEQYEKFRRYAEQHGKTVTGMVKSLILDCIADMEQHDDIEQKSRTE